MEKTEAKERPVAERVLTPAEIESRAKSWERTFEALKANPAALNRLYDMLNHTLTNDGGETLFIPAEDAAEVYTTLFMAWSAGPEMLADLMRYADTEKDGRAITRLELVKIKAESETDDTVEFEPAAADTEPTSVVLMTDWT